MISIFFLTIFISRCGRPHQHPNWTQRQRDRSRVVPHEGGNQKPSNRYDREERKKRRQSSNFLLPSSFLFFSFLSQEKHGDSHATCG